MDKQAARTERAPVADGRPTGALGVLCSAFDDLLHFAAVDVEFTGYRSLAVTSAVPRPYGLFQGWRRWEHWWFALLQGWYRVVRLSVGEAIGVVVVLRPDKQHEEFE